MLLQHLLILFRFVSKSAAIRQNNILGWTSHYLDTVATSNSNLYPLPDASRFSVQDGHDSSPISPDIPFDQDPEISPPPLEVVPLLVSGSSANRVDFVFFSDGYIAEERDKFVTDALRLAEDVSKNQTFNTVQPLLNFWAAFTPSKESGIGVNGIPKNTPFGLYRDGTELRGVYYEHPAVGRAACNFLGDQCDFPILLGNDPLYGGLGGDFTVITSSILNGPLVLRHELGHSILNVGEEYDGGTGYFGRNAAYDIHELPWKQWLSDPLRLDANGDPRVERSVMALQAYPWSLLNVSRPWAIDFTSPGIYARHSLQFSLSGLPKQEDLRVTLDGVDLGWTPRPDIGMDRWFYNFHSSEPLTPGKHRLEFALLNGNKEGSAQLCSTEVLQYGTEDEFISDPRFYSAYPTYSDKNETSYRPTNEGCLMRAVATPNFCKVCIETLWLNLLRKLSFIDSIHESCEESQGSPLKVLSLDLLPLANLRKKPLANLSESYTIIWKKHDKVLDHFANQTKITLEDAHSVGDYTIHVKFSTEEVRLVSPRLETVASYTVTTSCGATH